MAQHAVTSRWVRQIGCFRRAINQQNPSKPDGRGLPIPHAVRPASLPWRGKPNRWRTPRYIWELANSEVGESARGANHGPVERRLGLWAPEPGVRGTPRASLDMGLRGIEAGLHAGYSRRLKRARDRLRNLRTLSSLPGLSDPGWLKRPVTAMTRGGASVVVRGRESRPHGEGRQWIR
jgi:hypothetical protein